MIRRYDVMVRDEKWKGTVLGDDSGYRIKLFSSSIYNTREEAETAAKNLAGRHKHVVIMEVYSADDTD